MQVRFLCKNLNFLGHLISTTYKIASEWADLTLIIGKIQLFMQKNKGSIPAARTKSFFLGCLVFLGVLVTLSEISHL